MANSVKPGVHGTHHHHHRKHAHPSAVPPRPLAPPKTPGPEGHNDASSPWLTTLLGGTPNVTGFRDWADHTLHEFEDWWHPTPGGIGKHPQTGQPVAGGAAPPSAIAGELSLEDAATMALEISGEFEGGYKALAGDGDGQATSFGVIQWNFGQNTLGPLLNKMRAKNAVAFDACFPAGANYADLKTALANDDGPAQCAWARGLLATAAGKVAWRTSFMNIANNADFTRIQHDEALARYQPLAVKSIKTLRTIAPELTKRIEFRTYAALYDLGVQQGGIDKVVKNRATGQVTNDCVANIKARVLAEKPATQLDLMKIVVVERGKMAVSASQADAVSRRMGILTGAAYASTEGTHPTTRRNSKYGYITQHGTQNVTGL